MAKLTKPILGAANGEVYARTYEAGEECPPELEDAAIEQDALESEEVTAAREKAEAKAAAKAAAPVENKATAPAENKAAAAPAAPEA